MRLSEREVEILRLIGKGLSRIEIGKGFHAAPRRSTDTRNALMKKLGVSARSELIKFAIREGFAEAELSLPLLLIRQISLITASDRCEIIHFNSGQRWSLAHVVSAACQEAL